MPDEIAIPAVGLRRVEAAVENWLLDHQRKIVHHLPWLVVCQRADGPGWTAHQGTKGFTAISGGRRLMMDEGEAVAFGEDLGCDLTARIAIDARRVHKEITRDVFRKSLLEVCHCFTWESI